MKCEICEKEISKKIVIDKKIVCSKHYKQFYNYGKFLDNNPRTIKDLNEYRTEGDETFIFLYDGITSEKTGEFIIDTDQLPKFKYHKWRMSHSHVVTGLPSKKTQREASWVVLDLDNRDRTGIVVDHIDGNPLNNKKSNLRICQQKENVMNKSFMSNNTSGFIGVSYRKNIDRYDPEIRRNNVRCHLGYCKTLEEGVYKRYIAEQLVFKEFANAGEQERKRKFTENLPREKKEELTAIVIQKLKNKNLWQ